jgi:hypothetical protein
MKSAVDPGIEANKILVDIDKTLRNEFDLILNQSINPNTKGYEYEKAVAKFLQQYLDGIVCFNTRARILDNSLNAVNTFARMENEFDVVASFSAAYPRIVMKTGDTITLPYDGVAAIIEVKQTLTKTSLEKDLKKLRKLDDLAYNGPYLRRRERFLRLPGKSERTKNVLLTLCQMRPVRTLFYIDSKIDGNSLVNLLKKNEETWDMLIIYSQDRLIGSPSFPYNIALETYERSTPDRVRLPTKRRFRMTDKNSLLFLINNLSNSFPGFEDTNANISSYIMRLTNQAKED